MKSLVISKGSYSRVYEGKQQSKQFIIYNLDSIVRVNDSTWKLKKKKALGGARTHLCHVRALSSTNLLSIHFHAGLERLPIQVYNFVIMCYLLLFILSCFLLLYFHSRFHYCNTIAILDPLVSSPLSANYCSNSFKQIKHCTQ